jgi:GNAT superfamily N-acetyltransferase
MAASLQQVRCDTPRATDVHIQAVREVHSLHRYMAALAARNTLTPEHRQVWVDLWASLGLGEHERFHYYVALRDGKAVATISVFYGAGVAGLCHVGTNPEARRHGVGTAMTLASLRATHDRGVPSCSSHGLGDGSTPVPSPWLCCVSYVTAIPPSQL